MIPIFVQNWIRWFASLMAGWSMGNLIAATPATFLFADLPRPETELRAANEAWYQAGDHHEHGRYADSIKSLIAGADILGKAFSEKLSAMSPSDTGWKELRSGQLWVERIKTQAALGV